MVTWIEMHPKGFMMNQSGGEGYHEFDDRKLTYQFTENRFRGKESNSESKRILTFGDSFTFGLLLEEEDTYINLIGERINEKSEDSYQILNAAVGGSGLADAPAWLDEFGKDINPDVIVYFMNIHDVERALSKNIYVLEGDSLIKSQRWSPNEFMFSLAKKNWYRGLQRNSELVNILVRLMWREIYFKDLTNNFDAQKSLVLTPKMEDLYIESDYSQHLGTELFEKMESWCTLENCEFYITTTGFFSEEITGEHMRRLYEYLKASQKDNFFDITPCVDQSANSNLNSIKIPGDSHTNQEGAKIIADCTWNWMERVLFNQ